MLSMLLGISLYPLLVRDLFDSFLRLVLKPTHSPSSRPLHLSSSSPMASSSTSPFLQASLLPHRSRCSPPPLPFFFSHSRAARRRRRQNFLLRPTSVSSPSPGPSFRRAPGVSTVPVEHAPAPDFDLDGEISRLNFLRSRLRSAKSLREKIRAVDADSRVKGFFGSRIGEVSRVWDRLEPEEVFLLKCMVAAGQEHVLGDEFDWGLGFNGSRMEDKSALKTAFYALADMVEKWSLNGNGAGGNGIDLGGIREFELEQLKKLLKILSEVEQFYHCIGGIIGYQIMVLELLSSLTVYEKTSHGLHKWEKSENLNFYVPRGLNLLENTEDASQAAFWGIEGLPELGEIYPLGGAGDRLGLIDPESGECLPAALLPYCGRTLLEGLIRDLQAREFLYFKLYGKQCITPVAIMTSSVKNNHDHITALCEKFKWFGRSRENFQLFEQPLVPVVAADEGRWMIERPLSPICKPGGHGAIWKLAYDKGIFQWFYENGRKAATVRQVSNVVAATDLTLLALAGLGLRYDKKLGFASCQRNLGATEGINVLVEKQNLEGQWSYGISCIEYTEFDKYGIMDAPVSVESMQAQFPANTNILYVDLRSAEEVGSSQNAKCLPGMVLNVKKPIHYVDHLGYHHSAFGGRLECTMQNIGDSFLNTFNYACNSQEIERFLSTFIVYNERKKVTSSTKRKRKQTDKSLHQTPDGALLDVMRNAYDLLSQCNIEIPKIEDNDKYFHSGPPFLILLHPALGPIWEITRQKFNGGSISEGSELQLEVAELFWRDVQLDGSLIIIAENIMGATRINEKQEPILQYGKKCGRCKLQNVKVLNRGIDWRSPNNVYWKHDVDRLEALKVILHGNAEFEAKDVVLQGNHVFEVPDGYRMSIIPNNAGPGFVVNLDLLRHEIAESGSWYWKYEVKGTHIFLEMISS